jgi:parallel beta-helix repeat protein
VRPAWLARIGGLKECFMENRDAYRALAKLPALALLLAGAQLGCGGNAQTAGSGDPGTEKTVTSEQTLLSAEVDDDTLDRDTDGVKVADPPSDPAATDCGATSTTTCKVRSAALFRSFKTLQAAINARGSNDLLTVTGHCAGATVSGSTNLTIQGPFPTTGCGFNGPSPTQLKAEVDGLAVRNSVNVLVQFLNLVKSTADGVGFDNTINPSVSCVCAAFNTKDGVRMTGGTTGILSQIRSEANGQGIESNGTNTVIIADSTVTANKGNGIFVANATSQNVSFNIVTNNGGAGILFQNVTFSLASGNTIRNNGDGLTNLIRCINSQNNFGENVPANCM